jgi:hypothetical protein
VCVCVCVCPMSTGTIACLMRKLSSTSCAWKPHLCTLIHGHVNHGNRSEIEKVNLPEIQFLKMRGSQKRDV